MFAPQGAASRVTIVFFGFLLSSCASIDVASLNRPYEGKSGSVVWRVEEIRAIPASEGREVRWDYTLILTETRGADVRFDVLETGGDLPLASERFDRRLAPNGELRVARSVRRQVRESERSGFGQGAGMGTISVVHRFRGRDERGELVDVVLAVPLNAPDARTAEAQRVEPTPEGELTRTVRTMRQRVADWVRPKGEPVTDKDAGSKLSVQAKDAKETPKETTTSDPPYTGEVLTNDAVVSLVRAGLSEGVIVAKIRTTPNRFDVTTEALIELKRRVVPERIIEAMVAARAGAGSVAMPPADDPSAPRSPPVAPPPLRLGRPLGSPGLSPGTAGQGVAVPVESQAVHHLANGRRIPLRQARGKLEFTHQVVAVKIELVVAGRTAKYRVKEKRPVFHTLYAHPEHIQLAKLRIGGKDDRNLKLLSGHAFQFQMNMGFTVDEDDEVPLVTEPDPQGGYRLRPERPLEPGEYGFVGAPWGAGGVTGFVNMPEFGVD